MFGRRFAKLIFAFSGQADSVSCTFFFTKHIWRHTQNLNKQNFLSKVVFKLYFGFQRAQTNAFKRSQFFLCLNQNFCFMDYTHYIIEVNKTKLDNITTICSEWQCLLCLIKIKIVCALTE